MTVTLDRDESRPIYFRFSAAPPGPVDVDLGSGGTVWHPLDMSGRVGTLLVCGPDAVPPTDAYISVPADCVPRVRAGDGEIASDGWLRVRAQVSA